MHVEYPLGRGPLMGRIFPSGSLTVARTAAFPRLMHRYSASWASPCWYWGCGLETTSLFYYYSFGVPRPEASTPLSCRLLLVPPPPRSLPPVGIGGWHHPTVSTSWSEPSQRPRPVNARGLVDPPSHLTAPLMGPTKC